MRPCRFRHVRFVSRSSRAAAPPLRKGRPPFPDMRWAWFFDLDGTLVEIASRPSGIVVQTDLLRIVEKLRTLSGGAVSLVTGRAIDDVDNLPFEGLHIAGQHGLEIRSPAGVTVEQIRPRGDVEIIKQKLEEAAALHPGLIVEYKGLSIALHYRLAPHLAAFSHRLVRSLGRKYASGWVIQTGKMVVELKPSGPDKGVAIRNLMELEPFRGRKPVFIGDDATDEAGFKAVNALGGYSIKVGRGSTAANFRLRDVSAVRSWLLEGVKKQETSPHGAA